MCTTPLTDNLERKGNTTLSLMSLSIINKIQNVTPRLLCSSLLMPLNTQVTPRNMLAVNELLITARFLIHRSKKGYPCQAPREKPFSPIYGFPLLCNCYYQLNATPLDPALKVPMAQTRGVIIS